MREPIAQILVLKLHFLHLHFEARDAIILGLDGRLILDLLLGKGLN